MVNTTIAGDNPLNYAINQQTYDIVTANLERKGITPNIARVLAYEVLLIANITQQPYNTILAKISANGLNIDQQLIDQLNLLRGAGNKLGVENLAKTNKFISRAIV